MLVLENVTKTFASLTALDQLSFQLEKGKTLGMIGQNGSGKTTAFRLILNLMAPDQGKITWNGEPISHRMSNTIGYLPEERGLNPKYTIEDQIFYFAALRGKSASTISPKIDGWLKRFEVRGKRRDKIKSLSKGNQQKVQLIATLIHEPKLVILDEPFSGLDPINASLLEEAILDLRQEETCVIFSDHNMDNVERICDELIMLQFGQKILDGSLLAIRQQFPRTKLLVDSRLNQAQLLSLPGVRAVQPGQGHHLVYLTDESYGRDIFHWASAQLPFLDVFHLLTPSLDEIFRLKVGELDG